MDLRLYSPEKRKKTTFDCIPNVGMETDKMPPTLYGDIFHIYQSQRHKAGKANQNPMMQREILCWPTYCPPGPPAHLATTFSTFIRMIKVAFATVVLCRSVCLLVLRVPRLIVAVVMWEVVNGYRPTG